MIEMSWNVFCAKKWETIREILIISEAILSKKGVKRVKNDKSHTLACDNITKSMKLPQKNARMLTTQSRLCNESADKETDKDSRDEDDSLATVSIEKNSSSSRTSGFF
jgi:hypothetical protein